MSDLPFITGITPERVGLEFVEMDACADAKVCRTRALIHAHQAEKYLSGISDALRACPQFDDAADEAIRLLMIELEGLGAMVQRFRELRECAGQG